MFLSNIQALGFSWKLSSFTSYMNSFDKAFFFLFYKPGAVPSDTHSSEQQCNGPSTLCSGL